MTAPAFEGWAVVELLGHRVRYGRVTEVTMFGEAFCKIEIPTDPPTIEHYSGKALYGIREANEATIRAYHAPRRALTAGETMVDDSEWDGPDDDDAQPEPPRCGGCRMTIHTGEPTADVRVDEDGTEAWHETCAKAAHAEHVSPVDDIDAEVAF